MYTKIVEDSTIFRRINMNVIKRSGEEVVFDASKI